MRGALRTGALRSSGGGCWSCFGENGTERNVPGVAKQLLAFDFQHVGGDYVSNTKCDHRWYPFTGGGGLGYFGAFAVGRVEYAEGKGALVVEKSDVDELSLGQNLV